MSGGGRSEAIRSYRDLEVWQTAVDIAAQTYQFTGKSPRDELYGLTSQMRRAAVSIAANIAEGYGRESTASYIIFASLRDHSRNLRRTSSSPSGSVSFRPTLLRLTSLQWTASVGCYGH